MNDPDGKKPARLPRDPRDWLLIVLTVAVIVLSVLVPVSFVQIQDSRHDSIVTACRAQNERHDATLRALDAVIDQRVMDLPPARRTAARVELRKRLQSTVLLIDALAPRRDCQAVARDRVDSD